MALLATIAIASAVPLWTLTFPPLTDLPQHVHLTAVTRDLLFGGGSPHYELRPANFGYLCWYSLAGLIALLTGPLIAVKLLLSASALALPLSVAAVCRALGRGNMPAFAALGLAWHPLLYLGFAQFVAAVPIAFFAVAALLRGTRRWGGRADRRWAAVLGALALALHPLAGLLYGAVWLTRLRRAGWRSALLTGVPAGLTGLLWLSISDAGQDWWATLLDSSVETVFHDAPAALGSAHEWLADILKGTQDSQRFAAWCLLLIVGFALGRSPRRPGLTLVGIGLLSLFLLAPMARGWVWPIAPRFLLLGSLLLITVLPFPDGRWSRRALVLAHGVVAVVAIVQTVMEFEDFERETGDFADVVDCVPEGSRIASWMPETGSDNVRFWPFTHFGGFVQAERGGSVAFSFASHPSAPVQWRSDPPAVPSNGFKPHRTEPVRALAPFDVVLLRGEDARLDDSDNFHQLCAGDEWSVWQPAGDDRPGGGGDSVRAEQTAGLHPGDANPFDGTKTPLLESRGVIGGADGTRRRPREAVSHVSRAVGRMDSRERPAKSRVIPCPPEQPMTRVMRDELLEVAANLLERDGLPRLARAVRAALSELSPTERHGTAMAVLASIAGGVLDDTLVQRLVEFAQTPEERLLVGEVSAGGPTRIAAVTRLAETIAQGEGQATAASSPAETS